jgi:REP element-mobilizing transposase RayT
MSRSRFHFGEDPYPHFLTCTIVAWLPVFTRPATVQILLDCWGFLQEQGRLRLFGFVILENHLHLIASSTNLHKEIGDFKSFTARKIIDHLQARNVRTLLEQLHYYKARHKTDREHQLWQEGSHPKIIENEKVMQQKLDYIHLNPVKRGYVDKPEDWRYSSARNYSGREGLLAVSMDW